MEYLAIMEFHLVPACTTKGEEFTMVSMLKCHANEGMSCPTNHH